MEHPGAEQGDSNRVALFLIPHSLRTRALYLSARSSAGQNIISRFSKSHVYPLQAIRLLPRMVLGTSDYVLCCQVFDGRKRVQQNSRRRPERSSLSASCSLHTVNGGYLGVRLLMRMVSVLSRQPCV